MTSIICADDDSGLRSMYSEILTTRGYEVRLCSRGDELLEEYDRQPSDLLILDIEMPGKSGIEICKDLRKRPISYNVPIILVSGLDSEDIISMGLAVGADDYILKPFNASELLGKITALIRKREALQKSSYLTLGSTFASHYNITDKIGSGGYGQVYHARDLTKEDAENEVAIKVFDLSPAQKDDKDFIKYFLREAYGLSKIDHSNIVKLLDFGNDNRVYYLVFEYIKGHTLYEIVKGKGAVDEDSAIRITYGIADALSYLHNTGIIHRDISPKNVMIDDSGGVKLLDFGLARNQNDTAITTANIFKGTIHFVSPECIRGLPDIDTMSDVFSLGATMYYALTANIPFSGSAPDIVLKNQLGEKLKSICRINSTVSKNFSKLIESMMAKNRKKRPSAPLLVDALTELIDKCGISPNSTKKLGVAKFNAHFFDLI